MKRVFQASFIGIFFLVLHACKPDCSNHMLTEEESAFLPFESGMTALFENDSSGQVETLTVQEKNYWEMEIDGCRGTRYAVWQKAVFPPLTQDSMYTMSYLLKITVDHHREFPEMDSFGYFNMELPPQAITVNNVTYYDVYSVEIDSNKIERIKIPWKIDYSKTQGFVRFHMLNGVKWNRK